MTFLELTKQFLLLTLLVSCIPGTKSALQFVDKTIETGSDPIVVPLEATYESLNFHLMEKSCLQCHHKDQDQYKVLEGEDIFNDNLLDIADAIDPELCGLFIPCMPPVRNGRPATPLPSEEVRELLLEYLDLIDP